LDAPKTERKIQNGENSGKPVRGRDKKSFRQKLQGIFRSAFNPDRVRVLGLVGLVCVISIILFLTLKGGKKNGKNNTRE